MLFDVLGIQGRDFALEAHREVHQLYDGYLPYEFHLRLAAKTAVDFIGVVTTNAYESDIIVSAVWSHDVLEDTFRTYNDLKKGVNVEVADIVYAVTNEKGRTRKERANARYYQGIKDTPFAVYVKLCDRIANVTYGRYISPNKGMYNMYQKENDGFIESITCDQTTNLTPMIAHLRNLLRGIIMCKFDADWEKIYGTSSDPEWEDKMEREQFIPSSEEAREIIFGDHPDFNVVRTEIVDHSRWSVVSEAIVQRIKDSKFFRTVYSKGATEYQDERPFEFETPVFTEVIPTQKVITVYE